MRKDIDKAWFLRDLCVSDHNISTRRHSRLSRVDSEFGIELESGILSSPDSGHPATTELQREVASEKIEEVRVNSLGHT